MTKNLSKLVLGLVAVGFLGTVGCSSGATKRKEQQIQIVKSSKIYCEFVNGENQQDVDVVLNLQMGAKCDFEKPYTLTNYKSPADITGLVFCCGIPGDKTEKKVVTAVAPTPTPAPREVPVVPPAMPPVQDAPALPDPAVAPAASAAPVAPKVEERKPNSVKPAPRPSMKAPAKANPYSELDL